MWRTSSAAETRETILDLKRTGKTILLTTQNMHKVEQLCDRIAIISKGSLVIVDTAQDLKRKLKRCTGQRSVRGGSWYSASIAYLYIPYRDSFQPEHSNQEVGFRVVAKMLP